MNVKNKMFLVVLIIFSLHKVQAQTTPKTFEHKKNIFTLAFYKQAGQDSMVDFVDGVYRILKINKERSKDEALTKSHFTFIPAVEYSLATKFATSLNANFVRPSMHKATNNSTYSSEIKLTQNKQVISQLVSNIWTKNNNYNINTNWSYLKYPQKDFGLGSKENSLEKFDQLDYSYIKLHQSIVKKIAPNWYLGPGFNIDYHWNITDTSTMNRPVYGIQEYGLTKHSSSIGWTMNLLYDSRKSIINPLANTTYLNVIYRNNLRFLGSDFNLQSISLDARKYLPFPLHSKNILALWSYNVINLNGKAPYLDLPYTASDLYLNTGRGYIQGRFRGDKFFFVESEYRFGITENGFIGGVFFANMQTVTEPKSEQIHNFKAGYGAGIRIKLNKYSNTNIAIDYGIGQGGSHGIFMNLGEVF